MTRPHIRLARIHGHDCYLTDCYRCAGTGVEPISYDDDACKRCSGEREEEASMLDVAMYRLDEAFAALELGRVLTATRHIGEAHTILQDTRLDLCAKCGDKLGQRASTLAKEEAKATFYDKCARVGAGGAS